MASRLLQSEGDPFCTVWVFRYYDLNDRTFAVYGEALVRLIQFIQALLQIKQRADPAHRDSPLKVNIVAHSMGGLIVRDAIQRAYPRLTGRADAADQAINKIVTLGTPHKGISFQLIRELRWLGIEAEDELKHFNPNEQERAAQPGCLGQLPQALPARAPAHRGRHQFPQLRRARIDLGQPSVRRRRGIRPQLQPQRRPGEAGVRADRWRAAHLRAQVPRRLRLAGHLAGDLRDHDPVLQRQRPGAAAPDRGQDRRAASTGSARASSSSACRSSRAGSISSCSTRARRPRTATAHSTPKI